VKQETLENLFVEQLRDLYDAEKQLVKALPKIAKAASSPELSDAVNDHLEETKEHVARIEQIFQLLGESAKSKPCKGMRGLIEEGGEVIQEEDEEPVRDLALIAAAQKVEHYEISAYGTARTIAEQLDNQQAAELLQQTEDEEKAADSKLSEIAEALYGIDEEAEGEEEGETVTAGRNGSSRRNGAKKSGARSAGGARSKSRR
jgi:ferritin-like metal-binding protein YciE